ncbi:MAG: peroxiredoxin [Bdellovibrionales bacterium]
MASKAKSKAIRKSGKKAAKKRTGKTFAKTAQKATKKIAKKIAKKVAKKGTKKMAKESTAKAAAIQVGHTMPNFDLQATGGKTISLKDLRGKYVVLYFYPKDATPGCTQEGHEFSELLPQFRSVGAEVFGVSRDSIKSHENFKAKENYTVDLLSDADEQLCSALSVVKMKNMYGRQVRGIDRSTFVIDPEGRLVKEWRGVKVPGHAQEVLGFVKERA